MDNVYEEFSYSQIESIIHSFDGSRSLCTSNSWEVYKGDYLGKCVTVKIWWHPEKDDVEHFKHEMNFLKSQADSGQDIVNILGHCSCSELVALVLDLAPLCVLDGILTDKGFKWISRLKVALGIAQTISFLHDQLPAFVLRNLEPSHIMIDVNHKPVLYDFGFGKSNVSIFNTNEFKKLHTGHSGTSLTAYDVFDYGSIVLALLAMKPVLDAEKGHVVDHINSLFMVKSNPVIWEPSFMQCDGFCFTDAKTILAVALKCVGRSAKRPSMKEIVSSLENLMEIKYRNWCDRGMRHACSADQEPLKSKTAADIQELTGGFNREKVLWDIGFIVSGCKLCLFRGEMKQDSDNCTKEVTVKCCNVPRIGAGYFLDEMMFLTHECMTSHPNLAKLIGYCEDATMFAVIYDVASLCALEDKLTDTTYGWCQRMRAAFGIASAVAHLHSQNPPYVLHNLNPANIVLDKALKPIIVDYALLTGGIFGNKKFFSEYYIGSQAYLDHSGGGDVYSFGLLLLALVSGGTKKAMVLSSGGKKEVDLVVHPSFMQNEEYRKDDANIMVALAYQCVNPNPKIRPTMKAALRKFDELQCLHFVL